MGAGAIGLSDGCVGGILFIWSLHNHLQRTRAKIDATHSSAGTRGLSITIAYTLVLAFGAVMVAYAFLTRQPRSTGIAALGLNDSPSH